MKKVWKCRSSEYSDSTWTEVSQPSKISQFNVAWLQWSYENWYFRGDKPLHLVNYNPLSAEIYIKVTRYLEIPKTSSSELFRRTLYFGGGRKRALKAARERERERASIASIDRYTELWFISVFVRFTIDACIQTFTFALIWHIPASGLDRWRREEMAGNCLLHYVITKYKYRTFVA